LTFPTLTRVPGAKGWLQGLANVRGQLLPVIDLRHFAGAGETPVNRNSRVIVVNHPEIPAGFLVDEVRGFRRFQPSERVDEKPPVETHFAPFLTGSFRRGEEIWGVLNLHGLVESSSFLQAAE
ncbi:MAG: chemotaxis protein CheW, partial [Gammaproteobacteria bacterium]